MIEPNEQIHGCDESRMLSVQQIAERLGLSNRVIYRAIANGDLAHHRFGRQIRVTEAQFEDFIERSSVESKSSSPKLQDLIKKHLAS